MSASQTLAMGGNLEFASLQNRLEPSLLDALQQAGFVHASPVQEQVLQKLPSFTADCLVQAKTGTGKTIAFLLPALQNLLTTWRDLPAGQVGILVLAPTRELAQQIADECDRMTSRCKPKIECHVIVGGANKDSMLRRFRAGKPTIVVATPGRLNDILADASVISRFRDIRCVVLDEADRMLDQGFLPALTQILESLPTKTEAKWQGMCFSATMPPAIDKVLHYVLDPEATRLSTIDPNEVPTVDRIPQSVIQVDAVEDALPTLHALLTQEAAAMPELKAVVFASTARHADLLYQVFAHANTAPRGLPTFRMHSRMSQPARNKTVDQFKKTESGLMFASDVVGRGMDFPGVDLVVQVGLPMEAEQYVHRVGRTGRAGNSGKAVMVLMPQEMKFVTRNKQFKIADAQLDAAKTDLAVSEAAVRTALANVSRQAKEQAYVGFLGFMKARKKDTGLDAAATVKLANRFAEAIGCEEQPALDKSTISKMGLKGVPGLLVRPRADSEQKPLPTRAFNRAERHAGIREKHQGMPQSLEDAGNNARDTPQPRRTRGSGGGGGRGGARNRGRGNRRVAG